MQGIMETIFDVLYLGTVITLGVIMFKNSKPKSASRNFGLMAILLGCGDAFHLVPRSYALLSDGLANHVVSLGLGKWITSITMTIFYIVLYEIFRQHFKVGKAKVMTAVVYGCAILRIVLCFMPQNMWLSADAPISWGIYRNVPFLIMGIAIIYGFMKENKRSGDTTFKYMPLAIILSFGFYIPVVLWADAYPLIGMLMMPKTLAYVWIVWMGYTQYKKELN